MSTYPAHIDLIDNQGRRVPATTIKPSTLGPEVGLGIFAAEDVCRGEHMGWYYGEVYTCLLYTSPSPRDAHESRMPSSA